MPTIRIGVQSGDRLDFDLRHLLAVLGGRGLRAEWSCEVRECVPRAGSQDALHGRFESASHISGADLVELAEATHQVIDGRFIGRLPVSPDPWIELRAVDSAFWEVRGAASDLDLFRDEYQVLDE